MTKELKKPSIVFIMGSQGAGKTTLTAKLNLPRFDKDLLDVISTKTKSRYHAYSNIFSFSHGQNKIDKQTLYQAIVNLAKHNASSDSPVIIEGNFGARLNIEFLYTAFGVNCFEQFNFYIIRIFCKDRDMQHNRLLQRSEAEITRCTKVEHNGKIYDLTNRESFNNYLDIREKEELSCINRLREYVNIISIDNSIEYDPRAISKLANDVLDIITTNGNMARSFSLTVSNFRESVSQVDFGNLYKAMLELDMDRSSESTTASPASSPEPPSASSQKASNEILHGWSSKQKMPPLDLQAPPESSWSDSKITQHMRLSQV